MSVELELASMEQIADELRRRFDGVFVALWPDPGVARRTRCLTGMDQDWLHAAFTDLLRSMDARKVQQVRPEDFDDQ